VSAAPARGVIPRLHHGSVPPATGHPQVFLVAPEAINDVAGVDASLARRACFDGSLGQTWVLPGPHGDPCPMVLAGLGPTTAVTPEALSRALVAAAPAYGGSSAIGVRVVAGQAGMPSPDHCAWLIAAAVTFGTQRLALEPPRAVYLLGEAGTHRGSFESGALTGLSRARAAELVDLPPNRLPPRAFAALARERAQQAGVACDVLEGERLLSLGAGGLVAIGGGSANPPALAHITSGPRCERPDLVVVGKGITFDSGGLSLKSSDSMTAMKYDMAGAAVALETALLAAQLHPGLRVDAILALAENMPGGSACRPGDVVSTVSGRTVEILNTDFEGRVVLADALGYAMRLQPRRVVDVATLTEGSMFALGPQIGALFSANDELADELLTCARDAGEPLWRLPLDHRYDEQLASGVADVRNFPGHRYGRAITAATFLSRFVDGDVPWAHLDIAGPAWASEQLGGHGATGYGVGTLARALTISSVAHSTFSNRSDS
jgi:leucyl aminopeptidase